MEPGARLRLSKRVSPIFDYAFGFPSQFGVCARSARRGLDGAKSCERLGNCAFALPYRCDEAADLAKRLLREGECRDE